MSRLILALALLGSFAACDSEAPPQPTGTASATMQADPGPQKIDRKTASKILRKIPGVDD